MQEVNLGKYKVEVPTQFFDYGFWGVFMLGEIIAIIIVLIIGVRGVFAGTVTVGTLVMFIRVHHARCSSRSCSSREQLNFIQRSLIVVERVFGILETEPSVQDGPAARSRSWRFDHEIAFENVGSPTKARTGSCAM